MADIRSLTVRSERWPIAGAFTISRGSKTAAEVVVAELTEGAICGRGECVPYARYGETIAGVAAAIAGLAEDVACGLGRTDLQRVLPAGAARNALDCAFIDLDAKRSGRPVHECLGLDRAATAAHRLHDFAGDARRHGGGGRRRVRAPAAQG